MSQVDWLWMEEDELRVLCITLANLLHESQLQVYCMAQNVDKAIEYGYREGYTAGALQLPYAPQERDAEGVVLH